MHFINIWCLFNCGQISGTIWYLQRSCYSIVLWKNIWWPSILGLVPKGRRYRFFFYVTANFSKLSRHAASQRRWYLDDLQCHWDPVFRKPSKATETKILSKQCQALTWHLICLTTLSRCQVRERPRKFLSIHRVCYIWHNMWTTFDKISVTTTCLLCHIFLFVKVLCYVDTSSLHLQYLFVTVLSLTIY